MRRVVTLSIALLAALSLTGCAAWNNVAYTDDLYAIHDKIAIANRQKAEAELAKAEAEARQAQAEASFAEAKALAAQQGLTVKEGNLGDLVDSYDSVLADSYESAYARRLYGFSSGSYRMPSSYYTLRYNNAFTYSSAYDPAFYNVVVSGDLVWVEPKYITSMFGTWGATVVPAYSWYYGWYSPWDYWDWSYRYNPYFARYPYRWDWRCNWYWGWGHHHHRHHHYYPHRNHHNRPRPHLGHGGVGNSGHHSGHYGSTSRNPRATTPSVRESSNSRPPISSSSRVGGSSSSSSSNNRTGTSGRYSGAGHSNQGSSTYRSSSSSSYSSGSSSRSSSSSSSFGGSRSSGGGGSSSYSGGNSRGR